MDTPPIVENSTSPLGNEWQAQALPSTLPIYICALLPCLSIYFNPALSMPSSKPTFLLIHGSWHPKEVWERVLPFLNAAGYNTITPQVCFCGTEKPVASILPCITQVQGIIAQETSAGRDVVVVNHSFGGVVGCSAVKGYTATDPSNITPGAAGRVIGIVQTCAFTIPSNTGMREFVVKGGGMTPIAVAGPDGWDVFIRDPASALYQDLDPDDAKQWVSRLMKHSCHTRDTREGVYSGWKDVPLWYILCTDDQTVPPAFQEMMIEMVRKENPTGATVRDLKSGHSPMLSMPKETADIFVEAAEAFSTHHSL